MIFFIFFSFSWGRLVVDDFSIFVLFFVYWQTYVEDMQMILTDKNWNVQTTVFWGQRDRWLNYDGVEDFCKDSNHKLVELPMVQKYSLMHVYGLRNLVYHLEK